MERKDISEHRYSLIYVARYEECIMLKYLSFRDAYHFSGGWPRSDLADRSPRQ